MAMDPLHLRELVIRPALAAIQLWSPAAEDLVLGTACQESHCGTFLKQLGSGPALGIFQMEPATHDDIWSNFLRYHDALATAIRAISTTQSPQELVWNLLYAAAMCRVHYWRVRDPLPPYRDLAAYAKYWKRFYNTRLGAGTEDEFLHNWHRYN